MDVVADSSSHHHHHRHRSSTDGDGRNGSADGSHKHRRRRSRQASLDMNGTSMRENGKDVPGGFEVHIRVSSAEAFWNEIEAILQVPDAPNLTQLDNTLRMFITFCAAYHDHYLSNQAEFQQAISSLLESELFTYHYERMVGIIFTDAQENTNPHELFILYYVILYYGYRHPSLFRSHRKWRKLLPTLDEVVGVDTDETFVGGLPPIESRLSLPATDLMYEVCRVQKLSSAELDLFDDAFIDHLFDLVEKTRDNQDERLNYAVIRLIVALNEQFMVATLPARTPKPGSPASSPTSPTSPTSPRSPLMAGLARVAQAQVNLDALPFPISSEAHPAAPSSQLEERVRNHHRAKSGPEQMINDRPEDAKMMNRVLMVLMKRLGSSKTFGENVIFMLNRAQNTPDDLCMQLLILKILYLLFTTPGTQEYFYTNDLRVLLDVFIRDLVDLPEECEALRHTYLRVLYPLLNHTQLRYESYKRPQIKLILHSLIGNDHIRDIGPTTKRLVERCLGEPPKIERSHSASSIRKDSTSSTMSMESLAQAMPKPAHLSVTSIYTSSDPVRLSSLNDVSKSLTAHEHQSTHNHHHHDHNRDRSESTSTNNSSNGNLSDNSTSTTTPRHRRRAPAPPMKQHSGASTSSLSSMGSPDPSRSGTPIGTPSLVVTPVTESGPSLAHGVDRGDLVEQGAKGVPPPIIEVNSEVPGWITFST